MILEWFKKKPLVLVLIVAMTIAVIIVIMNRKKYTTPPPTTPPPTTPPPTPPPTTPPPTTPPPTICTLTRDEVHEIMFRILLLSHIDVRSEKEINRSYIDMIDRSLFRQLLEVIKSSSTRVLLQILYGSEQIPYEPSPHVACPFRRDDLIKAILRIDPDANVRNATNEQLVTLARQLISEPIPLFSSMPTETPDPRRRRKREDETDIDRQDMPYRQEEVMRERNQAYAEYLAHYQNINKGRQ